MIRSLYFFLSFIFILSSCSHKSNYQNELFGDDKAQWIQDRKSIPLYDSLFYLEEQAPVFRKTFKIDKEIKNASLLITSAGYYVAFINNNRVGKNVLDPAWTDYSKKIYYSEYDITTLVQNGKNSVGVTIGNGFYNPLPLKMWGRINLRNELSIGKPKFILKLIITYHDGSSEEIVSDSSWKFTYGPIIKNSVYLGTHYDANKEIRGWKSPDFDDSLWGNVEVSASPGGKLEKSFFPPVQIVKEIIPKEIYSKDKGVWIVDMGENFTGTYKIKVNGSPGNTISFRFGERVYEDGSLNTMTAVTGQIKRKGVGGPGAPEIAWQGGSYIIGDDTSIWYRPEFTYHAYRYMEIIGLNKKPKIDEITIPANIDPIIAINKFPVIIINAKPEIAPIIIIPSTPKFNTPERSVINSPDAAKITGRYTYDKRFSHMSVTITKDHCKCILRFCQFDFCTGSTSHYTHAQNSNDKTLQW